MINVLHLYNAFLPVGTKSAFTNLHWGFADSNTRTPKGSTYVTMCAILRYEAIFMSTSSETTEKWRTTVIFYGLTIMMIQQ